jgi:CheY-like chemotaxis protein
MDGVTACREIHWHLATKHLPVVAVTANALPGDRERYLAAGLNDYLSKPIDPTELHRLLIRWLAPGASAAVSAQAKAAAAGRPVPTSHPQPYLLAGIPESQPQTKGVDGVAADGQGSAQAVETPVPALRGFACLQAHQIDTERALTNLMGNEPLYRRLLERFARERAEFGVQLEELLAGVGTETHNEEALNNVHSLKSLAGSLGMLKLESIAALLEQQLRSGQAPKALVKELREEITAMAQAVVEAFE